ncbi:quinone-dependent dihydroorotate dehydrogenase [Stieleria varia]|uniref:Dihydroorotate dehydrogenase (quinone) n=1 Tax=Stieleria varia TaxID=2528005 RepID=A0A5C6B299_9BACT|nr:quinone-dependent dihydroorotate dehydrogenase [Stieleria varia]TWU06263.1 Dihydroorotate dehydrogenase (quinone) [Stieleria varia]
MNLYRTLLRPMLFRLDAETAHHGTVETCRWLAAVPGVAALSRTILEKQFPILESDVAGLHFENPIGLAAGWDKSGRALRMIDSMGFGFAEIGSVSARPSHGNPRPRLFRLIADQAIIVNYGLPNDGAQVVADRLAAHRPRHPLGVNIVKTNDGLNAPACSDDEILADYERSATLLHRHASYLSLNLSCPNAKGGKDFFAQPGAIARLLERLTPLRIACPVFLKISPRDDPAEHDRVLMECDAFPFVCGFCFNLPGGKPETLALATRRDALNDQPGAVAGKPVEALINRCIAGLYSRMDQRRYVVIGAGGVFTAEDAYLKLRLGASLVQIYTALIYNGPGIVKQICLGLVELMKRDGFESLSQVIGSAHHAATPLQTKSP